MKSFKNKLSSLISHFSSQKGHALSLPKGFTLIELLIVIAILGILAASVLVAINPVKRINQAKDSTIKSDIAQIATAMQTYYTAKGTAGQAYYPDTVRELATAGELKSEPLYNSTTAYAVGCTAAVPAVAGGCSEVAVSTTAVLKDPLTAGNVWCWKSSTGIAKELAAASCTP